MPKLIFTYPDDSIVKYALSTEREHTSIGRGKDNKIILDHTSVSTHHASIDRVIGGFELKDLKSTNGIKENGILQLKTRLKPARTYKIGDILLQCLFTPTELVDFAQEEEDNKFYPKSQNLDDTHNSI